MSMTFVPGWKAGKEILERLGLPQENVKDITLRCTPAETVTLTVTRLVTQEETGNIIEVLEQYELHEKE